ncbi:serine hydrolase domain-containing protein [Sphingomonas sp. Tas61C01]|uniref:serine hydrolase domain-containing protein n=1 Tax=Sphingomonas sp. Tas61C01 TaxID=3458297 RepID=UPI00403ED3F6
MNPARRTILIGTAGAACAAALPTLAGSQKRSAMQLQSWMTLASVPGASWAVLDSGAEPASFAGGYAKAGEVKATTETLFEAASLSKPVLAAAIHDLVREGRVDLDEPVAKNVDFTTDAATRTITPRHLLSHSGGLPNWRTEAGSDLVSRFRPGSDFRYSGEGYTLLARLAEAVTGQTAAEVVRSRVLTPAGMTRSRYGWAADQTPVVAWAHDAGGDLMPDKGPPMFEASRDAGPQRSVEAWTQDDRVAAAKARGRSSLPVFMIPNMAAGLWTTAGDYARFLRFALRYPAMNMPTVTIEGDLSWGLGWGLEHSGSERFAWHWGANDGVANLFVLDLASGAGLVVLTNGAGGQRVYERAARVRFEREFDALTWLQP